MEAIHVLAQADRPQDLLIVDMVGQGKLNEDAMDVGIGLRLDFNYFIFRVDVAQRLRDPSRPKDDRWVIGRYSDWFDPILNLGIGYPF